jgi:predicted RNase H-like nuclease (RuvC/YqgF family)
MIFLFLFLKAQLRQREREIKRLELGLKNEQYMRCDLESDLKEKCSTLEQKGFMTWNRILKHCIFTYGC